MCQKQLILRLLLWVSVALTGRAAGDGSGGRKMVMVLAVASWMVGVVVGREPLTCWACSSKTHGSDCYGLDHDNFTFPSSLSRNCTPDQTYCTVQRIWYVVETGAEEMDFSVNRTCASVCNPSCMVIGDRTKIYSCTSCCSESYCNTGSSASSRHSGSTQLLLAALLAALTPTLTSALIPTVTSALTPTSTPTAAQVSGLTSQPGGRGRCDALVLGSILFIVVLASSSASRNF
ncbi:uncharacterized protein LOC121873257 isoform X1 [Homarus americanus]|uniref:uncharacterized protein LOC121873257 isoform X1 n=1 Tax=Homarus americanus TaxID=6706 RepID=UPI001C45FC7E|nr:uncharacterized protein LOC121873257 isoform X1 [Homarus americanus]